MKTTPCTSYEKRKEKKKTHSGLATRVKRHFNNVIRHSVITRTVEDRSPSMNISNEEKKKEKQNLLSSWHKTSRLNKPADGWEHIFWSDKINIIAFGSSMFRVSLSTVTTVNEDASQGNTEVGVK